MRRCDKYGAALDTWRSMHGPAASLPGKGDWRVRAPGPVSFPVSGRLFVHYLRLKLSVISRLCRASATMRGRKVSRQFPH